MGCFLVLVTMGFLSQHVIMTKPKKLERGEEKIKESGEKICGEEIYLEER